MLVGKNALPTNRPKVETLTSNDISRSLSKLAKKKSSPERHRSVRSRSPPKLTNDGVPTKRSKPFDENDKKIVWRESISEMKNYLSDLSDPEVLNTPRDDHKETEGIVVQPTDHEAVQKFESSSVYGGPDNAQRLNEEKRTCENTVQRRRIQHNRKVCLKDLVFETRKQTKVQKPRMKNLEEELQEVTDIIQRDEVGMRKKGAYMSDKLVSENTEHELYYGVREVENKEKNEENTSDLINRVHSLFERMDTDSIDDLKPKETSPKPYSYPQLNQSIEAPPSPTLSDTNLMIFKMHSNLQDKNKFLHQRTRLIFPEKETNDFWEKLHSIKIRQWDECCRQVNTLRKKRLREIKDVVENEEQELCFVFKQNSVVRRIFLLREKIQMKEKHPKRGVQKREIKKLKVTPMKKAEVIRFQKELSDESYQALILQNQQSKHIVKLFFILMKIRMRVKELLFDLSTKMNDEILEHFARGVLSIMTYHVLKNKMLGELEVKYRSKMNRRKKMMILRLWEARFKQHEIRSHHNNLAIQHREKYLCLKAFNSFVYGCLASRADSLGKEIGRNWFSLGLLAKCHYGWSRIVRENNFLAHGVALLDGEDQMELESYIQSNEVESYFSFKTRVTIKKKIHSTLGYNYTLLKQQLHYRKKFMMMNLSDLEDFQHKPLREFMIRTDSEGDKRKKRPNYISIDISRKAAWRYEDKLLKRCFIKWIETSPQQELNNRADSYYEHTLLTKVWSSFVRYHNQTSSLERVVKQRQELSTKKLFIQRWRERYALRLCVLEKVVDLFQSRSLGRRVINGLRFYRTFRRQKVLYYDGLRKHYHHTLLRKSLHGLMLNILEVKYKREHNHLASRMLSTKFFRTWKTKFRIRNLVRTVMNLNQSINLSDNDIMRQSFDAWRYKTQKSSKRRSRLILNYQAGLFRSKRMKKEVFTLWVRKFKESVTCSLQVLKSVAIQRKYFVIWLEKYKANSIEREELVQQAEHDEPLEMIVSLMQSTEKPSIDTISAHPEEPTSSRGLEFNSLEVFQKRSYFKKWRERHYESNIADHFLKKRAFWTWKRFVFEYSFIRPLEHYIRTIFLKWRRRRGIHQQRIEDHDRQSLLSRALLVLKLNYHFKKNLRKKIIRAKEFHRQKLLQKGFKSIHRQCVAQLQRKIANTKADHFYCLKLQKNPNSIVVSKERVLKRQVSTQGVQKKGRSLPKYFRSILPTVHFHLIAKAFDSLRILVLKKKHKEIQRAKAIHVRNVILLRKAFLKWKERFERKSGNYPPSQGFSIKVQHSRRK